MTISLYDTFASPKDVILSGGTVIPFNILSHLVTFDSPYWQFLLCFVEKHSLSILNIFTIFEYGRPTEKDGKKVAAGS